MPFQTPWLSPIKALAELNTLRERNAAQAITITELRTIITKNEAEASNLRNRNIDLSNKVAQCEAEYANINMKYMSRGLEMKKLRCAVKEAKDNALDFEDALDEEKRLVRRLQDDFHSVEKRQTMSDEEIQKMMDDNDRLKAKIQTEQETHQKEVEIALTDLACVKDRLQHEGAEYEEKIKKLQMEVEQKEIERFKLETRLNTERNQRSAMDQMLLSNEVKQYQTNMQERFQAELEHEKQALQIQVEQYVAQQKQQLRLDFEQAVVQEKTHLQKVFEEHVEQRLAAAGCTKTNGECVQPPPPAISNSTPSQLPSTEALTAQKSHEECKSQLQALETHLSQLGMTKHNNIWSLPPTLPILPVAQNLHEDCKTKYEALETQLRGLRLDEINGQWSTTTLVQEIQKQFQADYDVKYEDLQSQFQGAIDKAITDILDKHGFVISNGVVNHPSKEAEMMEKLDLECKSHQEELAKTIDEKVDEKIAMYGMKIVNGEGYHHNTAMELVIVKTQLSLCHQDIRELKEKLDGFTDAKKPKPVTNKDLMDLNDLVGKLLM